MWVLNKDRTIVLKSPIIYIMLNWVCKSFYINSLQSDKNEKKYYIIL